MDTIITGATLLSIEEAKQVPQNIRESSYIRHGWWWLRSPGDCTTCAAFVDDYGCVNEAGEYVDYDIICVRPALRLNPDISNLKDGDRIRAGKYGRYEFDVVCNGQYALCTESIGICEFREDKNADDANDYEVSDAKRAVDTWYKTKVKGNAVIIRQIIETEIGVTG